VQNLETALGPMPPPRRRELLRAIHRNAALLFLECARLSRLDSRRMAEAVECDALTRALCDDVACGRRRPIMATAHIGNWEWGAAWFASALGRPFGVVYKPLHNPTMDRWLHAQRERMGFRLFSTRADSQRELVKWLRSGQVAGILSDQDAGRGGTFLPFFGRPASTAIGLGRLAASLKREIFFIVCERVAPGRFRMHLEPLAPPPEGLDRDEAARRWMLAYHEALEARIRRAPDQYFWWHRRWKTRPKPEAARAH
jgi:KDO2-lipid IV(A) lauroyltransferase